MAHLPLRVAIVSPSSSKGDRSPAIISGATRAWLRARRTEPFAACASVQGVPGHAEDLLAELESEFRGAPRLSITTGLTRAIRTAHSHMVDDNQLSLPDERRSASSVLAAARGNGVYIARAGTAIVGAVRSRGTWARSGDPTGTGGARDTPGIGRAVAPHVTSEFCPLDPGDVLLLLPGVSVTDVPDHTLSAALHDPLDLNAVARLLDDADGSTSGLVIWCPADGAEVDRSGPWIDWGSAPAPEERRPAESSARAAPPPPRPATPRQPVAIHRTSASVPAPAPAPAKRLQ